MVVYSLIRLTFGEHSPPKLGNLLLKLFEYYITAMPLVECALNMLIVMPAFSIIDLSHLATVDGAIGLCGLTIPKLMSS